MVFFSSFASYMATVVFFESLREGSPYNPVPTFTNNGDVNEGL